MDIVQKKKKNLFHKWTTRGGYRTDDLATAEPLQCSLHQGIFNILIPMIPL